MSRRAWSIASVVACCGASMSLTANGQGVTELTPGPSAILSEGEVVPTHSVSQMKIGTGHWTAKPVYKAGANGIRVVGILVVSNDSGIVGANLSAVYYQRPANDCDHWISKTWVDASPWNAVASLKATYGIPDIQDPLWEISQSTVNSAVSSQEYNQGFLAEDPVGELVNSIEPEIRETIVEDLKGEGYPVADIPFEAGNDAYTTAWLANAARFFDSAIGRNLSEQAFSSLVASDYNPPGMFDPLCDVLQFCVNRWLCPPRTANCKAETIVGEWQPVGELCNCTTTGPWSAACGKFTADGEGKIDIWIPFPLPRGTSIKITIGVGATINTCACIWQRRCSGPAQRTIVHVREDCSRQVEVEHTNSMTFTVYDYQLASSSEECQRAARPARMPPNDQPCGLQNQVPH